MFFRSFFKNHPKSHADPGYFEYSVIVKNGFVEAVHSLRSDCNMSTGPPNLVFELACDLVYCDESDSLCADNPHVVPSGCSEQQGVDNICVVVSGSCAEEGADNICVMVSGR